MRNENRAVFDRQPARYDYAIDLPDHTEIPAPPHIATGIQPPTGKRMLLIRLVVNLISAWRRRRNRNALLDLTDEQLKDIGISRSQAYSEQDQRRRQSHGLEKRSL